MEDEGASPAAYLYDAEGNRIAKGTISSFSCDLSMNHFQLTETYAIGQNGEEMSMFNSSGNWQRSNVFGAGRLLATYDVAGLHFHITDPLGTRRMQVNGNTTTAGIPELDCQSLKQVLSKPYKRALFWCRKAIGRPFLDEYICSLT
jgi:hypothetical protein